MSARQVVREMEGRERDLVVQAARRAARAAGDAARAMREAQDADRHLMELLELATGEKQPAGLTVDTERGVVYRDVPTES